MTLGIILRLWQLPAQVMLDDEWHALNFVLGRSLPDVFLQQGLGANSIPVNIYTWLLLNTVGWSELLLRLPSLFAGCCTILVISLLTKRLWGNAAALIAAALIATSPLLIFYSRVARPYGPVMFCAAASMLLTLCWIRQGRPRDLYLSAISGFFAVYYHLYAVIPVVLPLLVALVASMPWPARFFGLSTASVRPFRDLLPAGVFMVLATGVFVLLPNLLDPWWSSGEIHGKSHVTLDTLITVLGHLAGSYLTVLKIFAALLVMAGMVLLLKRERTTGIAILLPFIVFSAAMAFSTQDGAHAGIQVSRYGIAFFPIAYVLTAIMLVEAARALQGRFSKLYPGSLPMAAVLLWAPFIATSPLWDTYRSPNSFTNHSAFQYRYEQKDWKRNPVRELHEVESIRSEDLHPLYFDRVLLDDVPGIIEYPMMIGDHYNLYYYYQRFHRRPVVIGYLSGREFDRNPPSGGYVIAGSEVDYVMSFCSPEQVGSFSWRSMVDLRNTELLRRKFSGWLIVVHRNPLSEVLEEAALYEPMVPEKLLDVLTAVFGPPLLGDGELRVWVVQ